MNRTAFISILLALLALALTACTMNALTTTDTTEPAYSNLAATPTATSVTAPITTTTAGTTATTTTAAIPPGSVALFATISGGSQSDFLRLEGGNVYWDSNQYKFVRFIPEAGLLDEFGWTSSKSYSKSYIYGLTSGNWVYEVKCFIDSGRKDIRRIDPRTGLTAGQFSPITTADTYGGFTICGDRVYYRTEVTKDLLGNRRSGGNVMMAQLGTSGSTEVLDYYDDSNVGRYYTIGDEMVTIIFTPENGAWYYDIYRVDPSTLSLGELLYSFGTKDYISFYEGDTALYWTEKVNGVVEVVRFPLDGEPVYYLEITDSTPENISVDDSGGKVLLAFKDETPESPFYYLSDVTTGDIEELEVESAFFSKSIFGNGQFVILN